SVTELRVSGLSRRAVTEMIQEVLGDQVDPAIVERVAGRAQGNPYWIEELLRAEDSGQGEDVPDRVLLLAQSRIAQLPVDARRILRAGSVFGRRFWLTGARALLGPDSLGRSIDAVMRDLLEAEFLVERDVSRVGGEREFEFASGLLRDAAYSLLPEDEREAAHGLAAVWLEKSGLSEPLPIALHYTLGGEAERARPHYLRAAEHSLAGNDLEGALSSAREGLAAGASGRDAVSLRLVQAEANRWRGDNQAALRFARQAFDQATDPTDFYRAGAEAAVASGKLGDMAACREISERLLGATTAPDAQTERSIALCRAATQVILAGQNELARRLVADAEQSGNRLHPDPRRLGFLLEARALLAGADADPIGRIAMAEQAAEAFDDAGDLRNACLLRISLGYAQVEFGANQEAQASLRDALRVAERMDLANTIPIGQAQLGRALGRSGAWDEAIGLLHEAAGRFDRHKNVRLAGSVRTYLAEMHLRAGHPDLALEAARHAVPLLEPFPPLRRVAEAVLALVAMEATPEDGVLPVQDMKGLIERSFGDLASGAHLATGEDWVRLARLEWLVRSGDARAAQVAAEEGERLQGLAEGLSPTHRHSYLSGAPERRRLIARAERPGVPLGAMFAVESAVVPEPPMKKISSLDPPNDLDQTLADLAAVEAEADPILRNLWITQRYHVLSGSLAEVIDRSNVNWSTFACWASKTAGQSIRSEEIPRMVEKELHLDRASLGEIQGVIGAVLEWLPLGGMVRRAAAACLGDVSRQVAEGNRKVYAELAPLFARFAALLQQDPGEAAIEEFVGRLRPGPPETGGQDALRRAFHAWYRVSRSDDPRQRAESMLYANCMVGLHEQTRLQPNIQGAMNAPLELLFRQRLTAQLPRFIGPPVAFVVSALLRPFRRKLTSIWQRVATRFAMNLTLPRGQEIPLGEDLPDRPNVFPPELRELRDSELVQLVQRYDHQLTTTLGSGANDWADLQDRMGFIVALFRSRQQDRDLFEPPFSAGQEVELAQGQVPSGVL
ncbi:MAG TPA: hypothetical protein VLC09_05620, partial [Polyangiaceae bacterium]|nr:hypothetical protein [Polyangiaceae bacterium]